MSRLLAVGLVVLCVPLLADAQAAQDGMGLDLTQDQKPNTATSEVDGQSRSVPNLDTGRRTNDEDDSRWIEREVSQDDKVKSVQRKLFRKKHRFELAPFVGMGVNDPFYTKFSFTGRAAYYLTDTVALSLRGSYYQVFKTDDVRVAKRNFQSRVFFSVPSWSAMADIDWSPIYGKVSFLNSILHFDAFILGGAGVVWTETSAIQGRGPNPAADLGAGFRFIAKDFLAVTLALINTTYVDTPAGTFKGGTQNLMTLNLGFSFFFPLHSTDREEE